MSTTKRWFRLAAVLAALSLATLAGCGDDDAETTTTEAATTTEAPTTTAAPATTVAEAAEAEVLAEHITASLAEWKPVIAPADLFENLSDGDTGNDPLVVSVRAPEHYALGHIEGAINIPWRTIADDASLAMLPTDQQIVVYCYTGHTGQVAATLLRIFGYDAINMKFGMMGWTDSADVLAQPGFSAAGAYPTVTEATPLPAADGLPGLATGESEAVAIAIARAQAFMADWGPVVSPADLFDNLADGDTANDPLVVSVRAPEVYEVGHIEGAINIGWKAVATPEALEALPEGSPIVVYCYTGHTGQAAATALALLGYDVQNMKFGMMGWSDDLDVVGTTPFSAAGGYPTVGDAPEVDEAEALAEHITASLAEWKPVIAPADLFENLSDGDTGNDPLVVSVRAPEHYALGHIEGAINIPWRTIADDASLAMLPTDQQIVVYCYTGHTGQVAATLLRIFGYDAINMKFGMMGWTDNADVLAQPGFSAAGAYPTVTEATPLPAADGLPDLATGESEAVAIAIARAQTFMADWGPVVSPADLFDNLADGDTANDPLVVSVRAPEVYEVGHIEGAINIGWKAVATPEALEALPEGSPIVVYCYTGHTGQAAATALALLGYDVQNMKFGMMGWSDDLDVVGTTPFSAAGGYPTVAGDA